MNTASIEITEDEAKLLPLLYRVPLSTNLEAAAQIMKHKLIVDGLIEKVNKAFSLNDEGQAQPARKPRRR